MNSPARRAALIGAAMCATAALVPLARPTAKQGRMPPQAAFPERFGLWQTDAMSRPLVRPPSDGGKVMGFYDGVFEQTFVDVQGYRVMLSIAYLAQVFESGSLQLHLPGVCYRYAGYRVVGEHEGVARILGRGLPVSRMLAHLPGRPEPVTYWISAGGIVGNHAALRRLRIRAALERESLDGMLVRVSSIDGDAESAFSRHVRFANDLATAMSPANRAYFIGRAEAT
jgi:EpsI family protein